MRRLAAVFGCLAWAALPAPSAMAGADDLDGIVDLFDNDYLRRPINVARLPLQHAVTVVHGRGERVLYTFEDPDCGYCRELTRRLAAIGNVTVHTFPVALLGDDSRLKVQQAWCAPDRAAAWQRVMNGQEAGDSRTDCRAPLDKTMKIAELLGINFTPTAFFADGTRMVGLKPVAEIEQGLRAAEQRVGRQ